MWNKHLHKGLIQIGFKQSKVDECMYYHGSTVMLCYLDDAILTGPDNKHIDDVIQEL